MQTKVKLLAKKDNNKSILDAILEGRGVFNKEEYFNPQKQPLSSPYVFSDMEKAVSLIKDAVKNNDKILIWGDFDADGVTSTAILYKTFKALGANFDYFMPDRLNLGHGLNLKELLVQRAKHNLKLLITVDCGISNIKEISLLKSMGVKVIITDHHEAPEVLPDADCILNPCSPNSIKPDLPIKEIEKVSYLSGAGVAMKLAYALLDDSYKVARDEILILSAIGTIADVVPLIGENRIIAARGLVEINNNKHKGVRKLFENLEFDKEIKSDDVAFILAPRINSAGRLDSPFESIKLLISENDAVLNATVEKLNNLNKIRQSLCDKTYNEAISLLKRPSKCIVLYNEEWHLGIIGIVASKLVEKFNVPVFLITKDNSNIFRSSVRGTPAYNVSQILNALKDNFIAFGGHSLAGGFSADPAKISVELLKERIADAVASAKDETKDEQCVCADIELDGNDISFELISDIEKMQPFGAENKKPVFLFRDAKVLSSKQIGKDLSHLAFSVLKGKYSHDCLFWKRPVFGFSKDDLIDFLFKIEHDEFNGEDKIKLIVDRILNDRIHENALSPVKFFDHRQKTGILDKVDEYIRQKNGEVKVYAASIFVKNTLKKYKNICANFADLASYEKTLMLFDYPTSAEEFREIINVVSPENLHIMNSIYPKNPDDYISMICGMLKYASNNKNGEIDISTIAKNAGVDDICVQILLELLEKIESLRIDDVDKITFIKAPTLDVIHNDSMFEIYKDEIKRVTDFKDYFKTADIKSVETLLSS